MAIVGALTLRASAFRLRVVSTLARLGPLELAVALGAAFTAIVGTIGADSRWLAALGRIIVDRGEIPDGVPYASAPSAGWHNVPVMAELVLSGLTMSPAVTAAAPFLFDLFGGRQSARTIHFITANLLVIFVLVHLVEVLLSGVFNLMRSMITGRYVIKPERA